MAVFALLLPIVATAQFSISGKITNQQTRTVLLGATISINPTTATTAKADGSYVLNGVKSGDVTIKVTYIGYQAVVKTIKLASNTVLDFAISPSSVLTDEVTVSATRAAKNSPTAYTNLNKKQIQENNLGQDLPFLLNQTPSVVVTSDAGAGIGYTGIHIRGSDVSRINVTINGIPYNDSEEQGSFFVDVPDFASSVDNIQIQRGVGTSTNGAGAFGASINIQTTTRRDTGYTELNNTIGSYGTIKNTINIGTGLLGDKFSVDGRLSRIYSNGYIDRASSDLKSYFVSGAYYGKSTLIRFNTFSGVEHTYQAWNGVPEDNLRAGNRHYNDLGLEKSNGSFYKNQTDNYTQDHYQLLVDQKISNQLSFSGALHYTHGYGYYEEYKNNQTLADYGITPVVIGGNTIASTDLTRRLWLNNKFYGVTYNLKYTPKNNLHFILGGAYNEYKGAHYNNIEWTQQSTNITPDYQYSRNDADKTDFNIFGKADYQIGEFSLFADLQYRHVYYSFLGFDEALKNVQQQAILDFFNPKAGITYRLNNHSNVYASFAVGNHEPNRNEYVQSTPNSRPKPENLKDFELGYRIQQGLFTGGINAFYMLYNNQLVLTGALNDVGAQIRSNIKDSYRAGLEFDGRAKINEQLTWAATASVSTNKVKNFQQVLATDNNTTVVYTYKKTDIAFSPNFVGSSTISYRPIKNGEIAFISKYVSKQYLDNTSNTNPTGYLPANPASNRYLNSYFVNALRLNYNFSIQSVKNIGLTLLVNNIFNVKYETNGATYPDIEGGKVVNYISYYPQAPTNFLASLSVNF